jgi:hypothetical protein
MKIPRYLQIMLALTLAACLWSQFSGDTDSEQPQAVTSPPGKPKPAPILPRVTAKTMPVLTEKTVDLFPVQDRSRLSAKAPRVKPAPAPTPLPFQITGAWWVNKNRALILRDGQRRWVICKSCRSKERIWIGADLGNGWHLLEVNEEYLVFRRLPQRDDRRLALADMKSKPA